MSGREGQEPISNFSIRLSHTYVEINKMSLKSNSVVISFPKIIFEIEHCECKSGMIHPNDGRGGGECMQMCG